MAALCGIGRLACTSPAAVHKTHWVAQLHKPLPARRQRNCSRIVLVLPSAAASEVASTSADMDSPSSGLSPVTVQLEKSKWNSRNVYAAVDVCAGVDAVWAALTDYEHLGDFIPSLVENKCLERHAGGARLLQVGEQAVLPGVKFSATCTLDIQEYPEPGIPPQLLAGGPEGAGAEASGAASSSSSGGEDEGEEGEGPGGGAPSGGLLPYPTTSLGSLACRDISFRLVEGDFKEFRGLWRLQPGPQGAASSCHLCYALYVQPQAWLPVRLIQGRIEREVGRNLDAVRRHAEGQVAAALAADSPDDAAASGNDL